MTIAEQVNLLKEGSISASQSLELFLNKIESQAYLNAFTTVLEKSAFKKAKDIDARISKGSKVGKLAGTVVAVKDNIHIENVATTCCSRILQNFISPFSATCISLLDREDAIIIGKTNMDEFAMGSSTENSIFGAVKNPYNEKCVAGGSSGGSAVAVATGMVNASLGSDTGGSIRQPAAFTGIVGLKPTYGRVSRYGLVAFASSLDQIGPFGNCIEDVAKILEVIAGYDQNDSTSIKIPVPEYSQFLQSDISKLSVGIIENYFSDSIQPEIKNTILNVIAHLEKNSVEVQKVSMPHADYVLPTYYISADAEASSNLARYDGMHYGYRDIEQHDLNHIYSRTRQIGFGEEVRRRILLGTFVLSSGYYDAYYKKAQQVRRLIKEDYENIFKEVDCLITPVTPTTAFKIGEKSADPLQMYLSDIYTVSANLAGICALSLPVGKDKKGLPIGVQISAAPFKEEHIFKLGYWIENKVNQVKT